MKLKVTLLPKCRECGKTMNVVKATLKNGSTYIFKYCPDSTCRYAEDKEVKSIGN